jgi:hypothetical protein
MKGAICTFACLCAILVTAQDYQQYNDNANTEESPPIRPQQGRGGYQQGGYQQGRGGGGYQHSEPCQCYRCDGDGLIEPAPATCLGPSEACSVDSSGGCFGEDSSGIGGTCQCHTSQMTDAENRKFVHIT